MSVVVERLESLRELMRRHGVHACVVPTSDPHLSEYLPQRWQTREWLSGFTGSAGTLVVCLDTAALWADSRYWEQAEAELQGSGIDVMRAGAADVPAPSAWVAERLQAGNTVAVDGRAFGAGGAPMARGLRKQACGLTQLDLAGLARALSARRHHPCARGHGPAAPVPRTWPQAQAMQRTRAVASAFGARRHRLAVQPAWQRHSHNPVFLAHALIGRDNARLFVDAGKIPAALQAELLVDGIALHPYGPLTRPLRLRRKVSACWSTRRGSRWVC